MSSREEKSPNAPSGIDNEITIDYLKDDSWLIQTKRTETTLL